MDLRGFRSSLEPCKASTTTATPGSPRRLQLVPSAGPASLYLAALLALAFVQQVATVNLDCDPLRPLSNGNISYIRSSDALVQVEVTCDLNFRLVGSEVLFCQPNGTWNGTLPTCEAVRCESLPTIPNGEVLYPSTTVGSAATYTCIKGFRMVGPERRVCLPNATWTLRQPYCKRIVCKHSGHPANGSASPTDITDYPAGTSITYSCEEGYSLEGSSTTVCSEQGNWTFPVPECRIRDCGEPPPLTNGFPIYTSTVYGSTANYQCVEGYLIAKHSQIDCIANGSWAGIIWPCEEIPNQTTKTTTMTYPDTSTVSMTTDMTSTVEYIDSTSTLVETESPTTEATTLSPSTSAPVFTSSAATTMASTTEDAPESTTAELTTISRQTSHSPLETTLQQTTLSPTTETPTTESASISVSLEIKTPTTLSQTSTSDTNASPSTLSPVFSAEEMGETTDPGSPTTVTVYDSTLAPMSTGGSQSTDSSGDTAIPSSISPGVVTSGRKMSVEKIGIIVGIAIGAVLPVILIAVMCALCRRKRTEGCKLEGFQSVTSNSPISRKQQRERSYGAYEVRYTSSSPKEETAIMIEPAKLDVQRNGHVIGNGHDNHLIVWGDEPLNTRLPPPADRSSRGPCSPGTTVLAGCNVQPQPGPGLANAGHVLECDRRILEHGRPPAVESQSKPVADTASGGHHTNLHKGNMNQDQITPGACQRISHMKEDKNSVQGSNHSSTRPPENDHIVLSGDGNHANSLGDNNHKIVTDNGNHTNNPRGNSHKGRPREVGHSCRNSPGRSSQRESPGEHRHLDDRGQHKTKGNNSQGLHMLPSQAGVNSKPAMYRGLNGTSPASGGETTRSKIDYSSRPKLCNSTAL